MFRFIKIVFLLIVGQILFVIVVGGVGLSISPLSDPVLSVLFFIYTPMITVFERTGHYVGCANFIWPILYGVRSGVFIYGIVGAAAVCLIKKQKSD